MSASPLTWTDGNVTPPVATDFEYPFDTDFEKQLFVSYNLTAYPDYVNTVVRNQAGVTALLNDPDVDEIFWATPPTDLTPHSAGYVEDDLAWTSQSATAATDADEGRVYGSAKVDGSPKDELLIVFKHDIANHQRLVIATSQYATSLANLTFTSDIYWATAPADGPLSPTTGPVYETDMEVYIIEEVLNGVPTILPHWDFPTEAFAQGYIDTFGAGRDLRIIHFVKVTDETQDDVPAGTPVVWICEKTVNDVHSYMSNPFLTESLADFWTGIYGGPNATYNTRMLAEYSA